MSGNFGDLLKAAGFQASEEEPPEPAPEDTTAEEAVEYGPKVVLRYSKKGRGGKKVTLVSGVVSGREKLAKILKKQLGTGVRIEGEELVLQGDHRERAARWFESQGVQKVVRS